MGASAGAHFVCCRVGREEPPLVLRLVLGVLGGVGLGGLDAGARGLGVLGSAAQEGESVLELGVLLRLLGT